MVVTVLHAMPTDESMRRPKSFWEQAVFGYTQELARRGTGNVFVPAGESDMISALPADVVVVFNLPQAKDDRRVVPPPGVPTIRVVSATDFMGTSSTQRDDCVGRVVWDYHAALGAVFTHLVDAGAQRPGLLLPPKPLMPTALIRQAQDEWCRSHGKDVLRDESPDIAAATRSLLALDCDGLVVHGDDAAGDIDRVMDVCRSMGRKVPGDVLVTSISDGRREAELEPPVTSLTYDGMASGVQIATAVTEWLRTGRFPPTDVAWQLVVRTSTTR